MVLLLQNEHLRRPLQGFLAVPAAGALCLLGLPAVGSLGSLLPAPVTQDKAVVSQAAT